VKGLDYARVEILLPGPVHFGAASNDEQRTRRSARDDHRTQHFRTSRGLRVTLPVHTSEEDSRNGRPPKWGTHGMADLQNGAPPEWRAVIRATTADAARIQTAYSRDYGRFADKSTFAYSFVADHFAATGPRPRSALLIMNIDEPRRRLRRRTVVTYEMEIVAHSVADKLMNTASECVVSGEDGLPEGAARIDLRVRLICSPQSSSTSRYSTILVTPAVIRDSGRPTERLLCG